MRILFFLIFFYFNTIQASPTCVDLFKTESAMAIKLIRESQNLLPNNKENLSLIEAYFSLLQEHELLRSPKAKVPDEVKIKIQSHFSSKYTLPKDEVDFKIFYMNALFSAYSKIAWEWKQQQLEFIIGTTIKARFLPFLQSLMDSFFGELYSMEDASAQSHQVQQIIYHTEWKTFPWRPIYQSYLAWSSQKEDSSSINDFLTWYSQQKHSMQISSDDLKRIQTALRTSENKKSSIFCCKSSLACKFCPNNRYWLKNQR